jgi:hypothetical protein
MTTNSICNSHEIEPHIVIRRARSLNQVMIEHDVSSLVEKRRMVSHATFAKMEIV